jgi:hypothetical protein
MDAACSTRKPGRSRPTSCTTSDPDPKVEEVLRNYPVRQSLLWV